MPFQKNIYIIRHGQTDYNQKRILQGRGIDAPLNTIGQQQAKAFFDFYKHIPFDKVMISALQRTRQSVQGFIDLGIETEVYKGLDEISFGDKEGISFEEEDHIREYYTTVEKWQQGEINLAIGGGESPSEVAQRQEAIIQELKNMPEDPVQKENILICMHGRAMRIFLCQLLGYPLSLMDTFLHSNLTLYQLVYNGSTFRVDLFNNTDHLMT